MVIGSMSIWRLTVSIVVSYQLTWTLISEDYIKIKKNGIWTTPCDHFCAGEGRNKKEVLGLMAVIVRQGAVGADTLCNALSGNDKNRAISMLRGG